MPPRVLQYSDLENVYDEPARVGRLAALVEELRGPDTVVVGTGDNTAPGVLSMVHQGRQALDLFEAVAPDADTFGNHDFDYGLEATRGIVADSPQTWVSANVEHDGATFAREQGVVPSTVVETGAGRVGLVGVTDPKTGSMCPGAADLTFTDPIAAVRRETARLRERDVDAVVVLSHLGAADDTLARRTDVDAVLGGHLHEERVDVVDGTVCTRPGANGHVLLEVDIGTGRVERHAVADGPRNETVVAALHRRRDEAGLDEVVAHVDDPIRRDRSVTATGECRVGNFVADAYRWAADADVGLQNTGGLREGPPLDGAVTVADLVSVVPFDEPVVVADVSGDELARLCRQGDGRTQPALTDAWLAHVSGVRVQADGDGVEVTRDGSPLDPGRTYRLATTAYLLHTEHEFPVLDEPRRAETLDTQYEVLAAYAREHGIDPELSGRVHLADDRGTKS